MDFVAVPAGTTPDQALLIRGSDHDLELATADPFIAVAVLAWAYLPFFYTPYKVKNAVLLSFFGV